MKTSFINLSHQELRDFVAANSRLKTLASEANYLDGNLREENSSTKEDTRTALGAFHSALALNYELSQNNDQQVLENVLKLMHNSAMRIAEFFEHVVKTDPSKEVKDQDNNADIVIKKDVYDDAIYYSIKQKDGKNITISFQKDSEEDQNFYDSYKIEYSDSLEPYSKVETEPGIELRSKEDKLDFFAQFNADHFILTSIRAHSYDFIKSEVDQESRVVENTKREVDALHKAELQIPLQRLDLNSETTYVQNLYEALNGYLNQN